MGSPPFKREAINLQKPPHRDGQHRMSGRDPPVSHRGDSIGPFFRRGNHPTQKTTPPPAGSEWMAFESKSSATRTSKKGVAILGDVIVGRGNPSDWPLGYVFPSRRAHRSLFASCGVFLRAVSQGADENSGVRSAVRPSSCGCGSEGEAVLRPGRICDSLYVARYGEGSCCCEVAVACLSSR